MQIYFPIKKCVSSIDEHCCVTESSNFFFPALLLLLRKNLFYSHRSIYAVLPAMLKLSAMTKFRPEVKITLMDTYSLILHKKMTSQMIESVLLLKLIPYISVYNMQLKETKQTLYIYFNKFK